MKRLLKKASKNDIADALIKFNNNDFSLLKSISNFIIDKFPDTKFNDIAYKVIEIPISKIVNGMHFENNDSKVEDFLNSLKPYMNTKGISLFTTNSTIYDNEDTLNVVLKADVIGIDLFKLVDDLVLTIDDNTKEKLLPIQGNLEYKVFGNGKNFAIYKIEDTNLKDLKKFNYRTISIEEIKEKDFSYVLKK